MCVHLFWYLKCVALLALCALVSAETKCDHRPILAANGVEPQENQYFTMTVQNMGKDAEGRFMPDQRYAITLRSTNENHTFCWFMITVEDPEIDKTNYAFRRQPVDVGNLKTLDDDRKSKYSDRCANTVENVDNIVKKEVSIHWVSPKLSHNAAEKVRIRAMVAENTEAWYVSPNLSVELQRINERPLDRPMNDAKEKCNMCSEARYEVIFKGQWSKLTHPQQFPSNTDKNTYSYMVGASHGYRFTLWEPGTMASPGLKLTAEDANVSVLEREVMQAVGFDENNTRTLIRGRKNAHPNMFNPSHALFRADRTHHLFSLVIGLQPSPDWFLGVHKYELCSDEGWLEYEKLPLYPWDAGTMDGISYNPVEINSSNGFPDYLRKSFANFTSSSLRGLVEIIRELTKLAPIRAGRSSRKLSNPTEVIDRVALGSFDRESPFYQLNLNDLKAFGHLETRLLDVYPMKDCAEGDKQENEAENIEEANEDEEMEEPQVFESRTGCGFTDWEPWSPCSPDGQCGPGSQYRVRYGMDWNDDFRSHMHPPSYHEEKCIVDLKKMDTEYQECYVDCY